MPKTKLKKFKIIRVNLNTRTYLIKARNEKEAKKAFRRAESMGRENILTDEDREIFNIQEL